MQGAAARAAADQRVRALSGRGLLAIVLLGAVVTFLAALALQVTSFILTSEDGQRALAMDFRVFWAAGRLALAGEPLAVFDMDRLAAVHNVNPDEWMPWLYPPGALMAYMPLSALPFAPAFLISTLLSLALIAFAFRAFVAGSVTATLATLLAPAYIPTLILGQNNLFWLAGLLGALAALRSGRMVLAGLLIGCLTLKPNMGLLIPIALLAAGQWRVILVATATALILAALPTLAFGPDYWPLFAERMAEISERLVVSIDTLFLMVGPFYLLTLLGVSPQTAFHLQWIAMALAAVVVALCWRSDRLEFDAKAAALICGMLVASPYLWYYEAAALVALGLFLLQAGLLDSRPSGLALLAMLWIGGGLLAVNTFLHFTDPRALGAVLVTPALLASFAIVILHYLDSRRNMVAV